MASPRLRRFYQILPFGFIFLLSSLVSLLVDWAAVRNGAELDTEIVPTPAIVVFANSAMFLLGLLVGVLELRYFTRVFARKSFAAKVVYKLLVYTLLIHLTVFISFPIAAAMELHASPFSAAVGDKLAAYLTSRTHISTVAQLTVTIAAAIFYAQMSENIGHGTLLNYISGRYHEPNEEERIFMFVDMRSSTKIAEQLGHLRYFRLLRDYFADLSRSIPHYVGEVHEYVGDELVLSWRMTDGVHRANCLRCFFAMQDDLRRRAANYRKQYGLVPTFKAGLHCGTVMVGEIGVIKKDIVFTGDTLNATARIQGLCNGYGVDLLVSGDLLERLPIQDLPPATALGCHELRGRQRQVELYTFGGGAQVLSE
jgi:adenylate cyclase